LSDTTTELPVDPAAPTEHVLPSGKKVSVRSARTLLGAHVRTAMGAQGGGGMHGVVAAHSALIAMMVTELEPGRAGTPVLAECPPLDGTMEVAKAFDAAVATVEAQRGDDWRRLYTLVGPAWLVTIGAANITDDYEAHADPKADISQASGQPPSSEDEPRS
jgi:hypothetical protein